MLSKEMNWYYKAEVDEYFLRWNHGAPEPTIITNTDLPKTPYIEGFVPYVGFGIRF